MTRTVCEAYVTTLKLRPVWRVRECEQELTETVQKLKAANPYRKLEQIWNIE